MNNNADPFTEHLEGLLSEIESNSYNELKSSLSLPSNKTAMQFLPRRRDNSLYSMALYSGDMTSVLASNPAFPSSSARLIHQQRPATGGAITTTTSAALPPTFFPVDEYKDMSLKQILDITDDFLFGGDDDEEGQSQDDLLMPNPVFIPSETPSASSLAAAVASPPRPMPSQAGGHQAGTTSTPDVACSAAFSASVKPRTTLKKRSSEEITAEPIGADDALPIACPSTTKAPATFVTVSSSSELSSTSSSEEDEEQTEQAKVARFRPYQAGQWAEKYEELLLYRQAFGHCLVPHTYTQNLPLARWVKRQRYQYKLFTEKKSSTMTAERIAALEGIGFVWDSQAAAWGERLSELEDFKATFGHSNVPSNFSANPQLATWVKCQRRQHKLFTQGKPNNLNAERIKKLEAMGFAFELRSYKKARTL